ncbi:MAG: LON peptidase substrate-binding domain-containing protein [Rhodospirillaceae bacterium]|nr:LON peptidase substrate-binding domain-containing protein [Rhodospirillaceae bacterium]
MAGGPFDPEFDALPRTIPIFPLSGALLLPGGRLPLNIFEPRYLAMVADAIRSDRIVGMIQPAEPETSGRTPRVEDVGCAGRIVAFSETADGRYLITLRGLLRFKLGEELPTIGGYRRVVANWDPFAADMIEPGEVHYDRKRLEKAARHYFVRQSMSLDVGAIDKLDDVSLVTALSMLCPFATVEKQALLEATDHAARAELLTGLIEMAALGGDVGDEGQRH